MTLKELERKDKKRLNKSISSLRLKLDDQWCNDEKDIFKSKFFYSGPFKHLFSNSMKNTIIILTLRFWLNSHSLFVTNYWKLYLLFTTNCKWISSKILLPSRFHCFDLLFFEKNLTKFFNGLILDFFDVLGFHLICVIIFRC